VVAVAVGEADAVDLCGGDPGVGHLATGALPGVEEVALPVPQEQVAVVVTRAGGHLRRRAEDDELTHHAGEYRSASPGGPGPAVDRVRPQTCRTGARQHPLGVASLPLGPPAPCA